MPKTRSAKPQIVLIFPRDSSPGAEEGDRGGGQEQGRVSDYAKRLFDSDEKSPVDMGARLKEQVTAIGEMLRLGLTSAIKGYRLDEVTVSIAVSAEGSIGVATAGVEGSIELKFAREK